MHDEEYDRYLNALNEEASNAQPENLSQEALLQQIAMLTQQMNAMTQQMANMQQQLAGQKQDRNSRQTPRNQQRENRGPTAWQLLDELRTDYAKSKNGKLTVRHFIILRNPEVQELMTSTDIDMIGGWNILDEHFHYIKGLMQRAARLGYSDAQNQLCMSYIRNDTTSYGLINYEDFKFSAEATINREDLQSYPIVATYFEKVVLKENL